MRRLLVSAALPSGLGGDRAQLEPLVRLHSPPVPAVLYAARVLCPMTGPPLPDAGVLVDGERITAIGPRSTLVGDAARVHDLDGVLLPGFVDASTRTEHADAYALARPGPHHVWVRALDGTLARWAPDAWTRSARRGVQQLLRAGATTVGDIVGDGAGVPAASRARLQGDSFVDVAMVDVTYQDAVLQAVEQALALPAEGRRVGVACEPWRLGAGALRALAELAQRRGAPVQVEAARTQGEVAALRAGDGPLAAYVAERGLEPEWLDGGADLSPVRYLAAHGLVRPGTSLASTIYVDLLELRLLVEHGVPIILRPRADALVKAGEPPLERYAQTGVALAFGSGSPAGAPPPDPLADAAAFVALARARDVLFWPSSVGPLPLEEQAVRLATVDGARAMGWGGYAGVLEPGRRADLVGVDIATTPERVYADLVAAGPGRQVLTVLGGVRRARRPDAEQPWPTIDRRELGDDGAAAHG